MYHKYVSSDERIKAHLMKVIIEEKDQEKAIDLMWAMLQLQNKRK